MDISEAISQYKAACETADSHPPFEELVGGLIDDGYDKDFQNDSYFDALWLTHHMFNRTHHTIKIMTGADGDEFMTALSTPLNKALGRLRRVAGKVQVIFINATYDTTNFAKSLASEFADVFTFKLGKADKPVAHFMVCDSKMVRIEDLHERLNLNSSADVIKAKVNFNDPLTAKIRESYFDAIWNRLGTTDAKS